MKIKMQPWARGKKAVYCLLVLHGSVTALVRGIMGGGGLGEHLFILRFDLSLYN